MQFADFFILDVSVRKGCWGADYLHRTPKGTSQCFHALQELLYEKSQISVCIIRCKKAFIPLVEVSHSSNLRSIEVDSSMER